VTWAIRERQEREGGRRRTRLFAWVVDILELERILAHCNELQDSGGEVAPLDLGCVKVDHAVESGLCEKAVAVSGALFVSYPSLQASRGKQV
jgi:hypothetical protein